MGLEITGKSVKLTQSMRALIQQIQKSRKNLNGCNKRTIFLSKSQQQNMDQTANENKESNNTKKQQRPPKQDLKKPEEGIPKTVITFVSNQKIQEQNVVSLNEISSDMKNSDPNQNIDQLKFNKKVSTVKKPKPLIDNFTEFIPEFLLAINQLKNKSIVRIGISYQAEVPSQSQYSHKYRPINNLKVSTAEYQNPSIMTKFKEMFGEARTEQDLSLLMYQYQMGWDQLHPWLIKHRLELRKFYLSKDRTKPM